MSNRTTTSQQFRIQDIPEARPVPHRPAADSDTQLLRQHYTQLIVRFSSAQELGSDEAQFIRSRFAKMMALNIEYPLRAALSMLEQGQQLSGTEVAVIVAAAERGETALTHLQALLDKPALLPDAAAHAALRKYLLCSDNLQLSLLRDSL